MAPGSQLFEAYLKCPTKCWLRSRDETGEGNEYAEWVKGQNESYRVEGARRLVETVPEDERVVAPPTENLKAAKWRLALDLVAQASSPASSGSVALPEPTPGGTPPDGTRTDGTPPPQPQRIPCRLESRLHAVERMASEGRGKPAQFIPIRFIFRNKLTRDDRLLAAYDALALSELLGRDVNLGKIIHGDDLGTLKVKTAGLLGQVRKLEAKMSEMVTSGSPPDLVLNRHCGECEFRDRCRPKAVEKDDLSLFPSMATKERKEYNTKGIFTITQLSYTFRLRRRPKRLRDKREKYHHSLKALAIREKKIHIVGSPALELEGTPVYLDVEGLPDRDFYYLIGIRVASGEGAVHHSLWADHPDDEKGIWTEFLRIVSEIKDTILIHYGSYEATFLKQMSKRHGGPTEGTVAANAIKSAVNLLSIVFSQVYFPTYSNGLKDIGGSLGFKWSQPGLGGLQSTMWRQLWEQSHHPAMKEQLILYNAEDCEALEAVANSVRDVAVRVLGADSTKAVDSDVVRADSTTFQALSRWRPFTSPVDGFEYINNAAHWNYQRDRVYVRTGATKKKTRKPLPEWHGAKAAEHVEKVIVWPVSKVCPRCGRTVRTRGPVRSRTVQDLLFGRYSLKRRVVKYVFQTFCCSKCGITFGFERRFRICWKYGWNLLAYFLYQVIDLCITQRTVVESFGRVFGISMNPGSLTLLKAKVAAYYSETKQSILERILRGGLVHVDETHANIKGKSAFVWVLTNMREVVYLYAESREARFIQGLLVNFKGVLVSDFYAAYDAIDCPKQRCLIHLIRDLNAGIMANPFDDELKRMTALFAVLVRAMVETVDRRGLKRRFLRKHLVEVERFYRQIGETSYRSEAALQWKQRLETNREELFTFLSHDGVPWNNNNAEHAIKAFAMLREVMAGGSTVNGTEAYLTLLSLCQTCKYQGLDFLDFLRSGETDVQAFAEHQPKPRVGGRNEPF
jgi:predicted RecB family nuclease